MAGLIFKEEEKRLEDFLATDEMFVEYFNAFLSLPSFPEPVCFNPETGGFEVVSQAKKELGRQIKAAVRSQERKPKIYAVTKQHSFCDIPLIPIEEPVEEKSQEINTTFNVQTLNKEQGIHWIKAERLPVYLESECYLEYRLANILSQVKLTGPHGQYLNLKIDYSQRAAPVKNDTANEVVVDPMTSLKKEMFVSLGETNTSDAEAWFSTAKLAQYTDPTFVSSTRPTSAIGTVTPRTHDAHRRIRPFSARPSSAIRTPDYSMTADSGIGSPSRDFNSTLNISSYACSVASIGEETLPGTIGLRPYTPRPSEPVCYLSKELPSGGPVYMPYPRSEATDTESGLGDIDTDRDDDTEDPFPNKETNEKSSDLSLITSVDQLSSLIVGNVLAKSIATVNHVELEEAKHIPEILKLYPSKDFMQLPMENIEDFEIKIPNQAEETVRPDSGSKSGKSTDSDADSLLDSEDDFDEQDSFFRQKKKRKVDLSNKKGIEDFKTFISGTVGEIYWNLWIDIDKCRQITDPADQTSYVATLKKKYQSPSAIFPLSNEMALKLGLAQSNCWTAKQLLSIQPKVVEPLVAYWARRFLLKQHRPEKAVYPLPRDDNQPLETASATRPRPSVSLLPHRPKSCHPRIRQYPQKDSDQTTKMEVVEELKTSPMVGMKRKYSKAALEIIQRATKFALPNRRSGETAEDKKTDGQKLLTPTLPASRRELPRPPTSKNRDRQRPKTAGVARTVTSSLNESFDSHSVNAPDNRVHSRSSSRRSSAETVKSEGSKASSVFLGGRRMEALLQALNSERLSGGFFRRFVSRSGNKFWMNNLKFWCNVQDYHQAFYTASLDRDFIRKKAKVIFSTYIVTGAPKDIGCCQDVRNEVFRQLDPPFDDLFDKAEEHSIEVLYGVWTQLVSSDNNTYKKVELIEVKRHLETKSKYVLRLQKRGLISERVVTPDNPMEGYEDPVYDDTLLDKIPEDFRDYTLDKLIHNRLELEQFRQYLADNYANMDLMCWIDIEAYRRIPHNEEKKRESKAKDIKVKYLNKKYFFGANSPAGKEGQDKVMSAGGGWGKLLDDRPPNPVLLEVQKYVQERLEKKWLPQFLAQPEFAERQKPPQSMDNVIDDVMVQKRHKSQAVLKAIEIEISENCSEHSSINWSDSDSEASLMLESKWLTSSGDIMVFRKALLNPVTSLQFRRYISIKGDSLENDVLFWLEVQKYKELHHTNTDDSTLLQKVNAIINCFLESSIPPPLQIDIPQEMADKIIDRKYEKGPYLFREAQLTVFRVLFSHWNEFCEYRANLTPDKVLPTIERQRRRVKKREREKQQRLEEQREKNVHKKQEAARRQAMGLPPDGDFTDGEVFHDPFATKPDGSEAGEEVNSAPGKDSISWTYSRYLAALETEHLLNHLDESSLSSFTETGSLKNTTKDQNTESLKTDSATKIGQKTESLHSSKQSKKDSKMDSNSTKGTLRPSDENSLRVEKDAKSVKSVSSYRSEKQNGHYKPDTSLQQAKQEKTEKNEKIEMIPKETKSTDLKRKTSLTRGIPPLVTSGK